MAQLQRSVQHSIPSGKGDDGISAASSSSGQAAANPRDANMHSMLHTESSMITTSTSGKKERSKREQVRRACVPCARGKRKCGTQRPCEPCIKRNMTPECVDVSPTPPSKVNRREKKPKKRQGEAYEDTASPRNSPSKRIRQDSDSNFPTEIPDQISVVEPSYNPNFPEIVAIKRFPEPVIFFRYGGSNLDIRLIFLNPPKTAIFGLDDLQSNDLMQSDQRWVHPDDQGLRFRAYLNHLVKQVSPFPNIPLYSYRLEEEGTVEIPRTISEESIKDPKTDADKRFDALVSLRKLKYIRTLAENHIRPYLPQNTRFSLEMVFQGRVLRCIRNLSQEEIYEVPIPEIHQDVVGKVLFAVSVLREQLVENHIYGSFVGLFFRPEIPCV